MLALLTYLVCLKTASKNFTMVSCLGSALFCLYFAHPSTFLTLALRRTTAFRRYRYLYFAKRRDGVAQCQLECRRRTLSFLRTSHAVQGMLTSEGAKFQNPQQHQQLRRHRELRMIRRSPAIKRKGECRILFKMICLQAGLQGSPLTVTLFTCIAKRTQFEQ